MGTLVRPVSLFVGRVSYEKNIDAFLNLDIPGTKVVCGVGPLEVSLKQRYDGHAKRAALIAAGNAYMGRIVVVVDEDIDPSNFNDVMWAVATRCEPSESVDIVRNGWSSGLDPRISPNDKARGVTSNSKIILDATRPYAWRDAFPKPSALSTEEARAIEEKWLAVLRGNRK